MADARCPTCLRDEGLEPVEDGELCDAHQKERRRGPDRRKGERRMFPRAEGRRMSDGRRAGDAQG